MFLVRMSLIGSLSIIAPLFLQLGSSSISILIAIAAIIIIGYLARAIFHRTKIPEALIMIAIGLLLVPIGHLLPGTYVNSLRSLAAIFGDIALIVIMYNGGKTIKLGRKLFGNTIGFTLGIFDVILPMVVLSVVMYVWLGWPLVYGAILGAVLGETSTVIVIPIIKRLKIQREMYDALVLETTLNSVFDILIFTLLIAFTGGQAFTASGIASFTIDYISVSIAFGLLAGVLWIAVQNYINGAREYLATLAVAILLFGIVELFNGAAAISVLIFAIMIGNSKPIAKFFGFKKLKMEGAIARRAVEHDIEFLLMTFFFVFIGMIAILSLQYFIYAVIITVVLLAIRYLEVWPVLRSKFSEYRPLTFGLMERGTTVAVLAAILFSIGGTYNDQIFYICFMVIILTNIVGSLVISRTRVKVKPDG